MIYCKSKIEEVVTEDLIATREKKWRKQLPDSFKSFIVNNNGGIPNEKIVIKGKWNIERFLCIVPKISESSNGEYDISAVLTKYDEFMVFDADTVGYDLIPFAQLNHDSLLCLCYADENPMVVVWQLEGSKEFKPNYLKVYDSFDEFLNCQ